MKTKKNLRTIAHYKIFAVMVLLGVSMFMKASAQSIIPSTRPDVGVGQQGYPNSSTIDYSNYYCGYASPQLTAMVVDGGFSGCPAPILWLNDNSSGPWLPAPIPAPTGCAPDVVIGNDASSCSGNYLIAVVGTVPCGTGAGSQVMLFIYSVSGGAPFLTPPVLINICVISDCNATGVAHIDIIDEYSNLVGAACTTTPLAFANKFVVTWQSKTSGIMAYYANLNNPCNGITQVINANLNLISPDVAAVERTGCTGYRDYALFSYIDPTIPAGSNTLYEQEWDITLGAAGITVPAILDNTKTYVNTFPTVTSYERIDAIDDYNFNAPAGGNAYFDVAVSGFVAGGSPTIYEYNNLAGSGSVVSLALPVTSSNYAPQVACGPGQKYTVVYFSFGGSTSSYYATGVDWNTGAPTPTTDAYQINQNLWGPSNCVPWAVCVSTSHNIDVCGGAPSQETFTAFDNNAALWEKYSANPCFPYAFKPARTPGNGDEWKVSPNPTADNITLLAPDGFAIDDGTTYSITDLTGKAIKQSKVSSANEQVNVKDLVPGMYLININEGNKTIKTIKFVKE